MLNAAVDQGVRPPEEWIAAGPAGTGKSFGALGGLFAFASRFPRVPCRVLLVRLTRRSLTTSTCVTLRKVVPQGHPMLKGPSDSHRTEYPLGAWRWVLAGLDNVDNLLSTEWDFILAEEIRQFPKSVWEELTGRSLRNFALYKYDANGHRAKKGRGVSPIPFGVAFGMTNPGKPKHWILGRAKAKRLTLFESVIEDNPAYFELNASTGILEPTPEGDAFMRRREQYTGTRYQRMVLGLWTAGEGAIFPEWCDDLEVAEDQRNVVQIKRDEHGWITRETLRKLDVREFYAGVDFGDDAPGSIVVAGFTGSRKLIIVAEAYARKKDLEWWTERVKEIHAHYPITLAWCDHNRPDMVRAFNDVVGAPREGPGAVFVLAQKANKARSIALLAVRIKNRTIQYDVDALVHDPDESLVELDLPTCTIEEYPDYRHERKGDEDEPESGEKAIDKPAKDAHDHGIDGSLYLVAGVDYLLPSRTLTTENEDAYLAKLRRIRSDRYGGHPLFRGRGEFRDPEDVTVDEINGDSLTDEEWLIEQLRDGKL